MEKDKGPNSQLCHFPSSVAMGESLNLSSSVLVCKGEKASCPPSVEFPCAPLTVKATAIATAPRGDGPAAHKGQKVAVRQAGPGGCPVDLHVTDEDTTSEREVSHPRFHGL